MMCAPPEIPEVLSVNEGHRKGRDEMIMCLVCFGCAALFYGIGIYAKKSEKPMWFWTGSTVSPAEITDVRQYNRENARMWKGYSLWFAVAGAAVFWNGIVAITFLVLGCTVGIAFLVCTYQKIYKKYRIK